MGTKEQLVDLEHRFWEAATDVHFYREHVADDAVMVFPYGVGVLDKDAVVYAVGANREPWDEHSIDDLRVVELGDASVLLVYRATAVRAGDDEPFRVLVTSGYASRRGSWKLVFHQQTPDTED